MKTLEFKKNIEHITFDDLKLSVNEKLITGKSVNEINHYEFIDKIQNIVNKSMKSEINDIVVSNSGPSNTPGVSVLPYIEEQKGKGSIEAHVFRRVFCTINLDFEPNDIWNTKLAISYHQNSIEIAIGANIKICSNLSILRSDDLISSKNISLDNIFTIVSGWMDDIENRHKELEKIMYKLNNTFINLNQYFKFVGLMNCLRVEKDSKLLKDYINKSKTYPLNQGQISKFTEDSLFHYSKSSNNILSAYEVYNIGTNLHKPEYMETVNILPQNTDFGINLLNFIDVMNN